jgi:oxygen-independent coproporphyrinogen-3 oxidase
MEQKLGLYIHIPFCVRKCNYCDFNSYPLDDRVEAYLAALREEMKKYAEILNSQSRVIDTVYVGGGTPTCLTGKHLAYLFDYCLETMPIRTGAEFTVEANPGTIDYEKTKILIQSGVNRISLGLQAWQDKLLKGLGRTHSLERFIESYLLLREQGFKNISVDLMFGLPGQRMEDWEESLANLVKLKPEHISVYSLKLEEGTELCKFFNQGLITLPSEDEEVAMYGYGMDFLKSYGYGQYEISNFSLPGFESRHNLLYWLHQEYLGLGAGAHSYFNGIRYFNYSPLDIYSNLLGKGYLPVEDQEKISLQRKIEDTIILGLRLNQGIDLKRLTRETGQDVTQRYIDKIEFLKEEGLVEYEDFRLKLTRKGFFLANRVFLEFIAG